MSYTQETLGELIRYGLRLRNGCHIDTFPNWDELYELALIQGVAAIAFDGINRCYENGINVSTQLLFRL